MVARRTFTRSFGFLVSALVLAAALVSSNSRASGGDSVPGSRYVSGRGAAMGDAFIPFADDGASALFYNPAAIARLKEFSFDPINLQLQPNQQFVRQYGAETATASLQDMRDTLVANPNSSPGVSAAFLPSFSFRGFAAGTLLQLRRRATFDGTNITYRSVYQLIPAVGGGIRLASGVLRLGYSLQWVNQASGTVVAAPTSDQLAWDKGLAEGSGFSHNLGLAVTLPYIYQPALNFVARNVGGLRLSGDSIYSFASNPTGTQPDEKMSFDSSLSFLLKLGRANELRTAFEYRDMSNTSSMPLLARVATGMELSLNERFFLRGGLGSGYPSAGIGVRTTRSEVNLSWFSEEVGTSLRDQRDIRYVFHYKFSAF